MDRRKFMKWLGLSPVLAMPALPVLAEPAYRCTIRELSTVVTLPAAADGCELTIENLASEPITISPPESLSEESLEQMIWDIHKFTLERGAKLTIKPTKVWFPT